MPVEDMFWGDRAGTVKVPFGYRWMLATHIKDLDDGGNPAGRSGVLRKNGREIRRKEMKKSAALMMAGVCFSIAGPYEAYAGEYQSGQYIGSKGFERMKQLVGAWVGTADM